MKKSDLKKLPEGHPGRYDWSRAKRGRLARRAARATSLLRILDPELAARFPDSASVNDALHALLAVETSLARPSGRRRAA